MLHAEIFEEGKNLARDYRLKKADGSWSPDRGLKRHMAGVSLRLVSGTGPFVLTQDGDQITGEPSRSEMLPRYRQAIENREIGCRFRVRRGNGKIVVVGQATLDLAATDSTSGNKQCDIFWSWVRVTYPRYEPRYAGAYVCKHVSGSSTLSQHGSGNAVDIFFKTLTLQDAVYDDVKRGQSPALIMHAISRRDIWTYGEGEHYYSGDYHGHLHVDFRPNFNATSCGVRP
jgi:hypothetical protein